MLVLFLDHLGGELAHLGIGGAGGDLGVEVAAANLVVQGQVQGLDGGHEVVEVVVLLGGVGLGAAAGGPFEVPGWDLGQDDALGARLDLLGVEVAHARQVIKELGDLRVVVDGQVAGQFAVALGGLVFQFQGVGQEFGDGGDAGGLMVAHS